MSLSNEVFVDPSAVIATHSRSFSAAARCLPNEMRENVFKLYAWCRSCDDAVDQAETLQAALAQWQLLRDDVDRIKDDEPVQHPISTHLQELMQNCEVSPWQALDLLHGMHIDLEMDQGKTSIRNDADLLLYCYHAAGVVGLMMCRVMGVRDQRAESHAKSLGIAMQLTNIARDVREDDERGRRYLPAGDDTQQVAAILDLADYHYRHGLKGMAYLPRRCRVAIVTAAVLYREIGQEIRRRKLDMHSGRTVLPRLRFAWTAVRGLALGLVYLVPSAPRPARGVPKTSFQFPSFFSNYLSVIQCLPFPVTSRSTYMIQPNSQSRSSNVASANAFLGISLTSLMATVLFILVYVNPKETTYTWLPLIYSLVSFVIAIVTYYASRRYSTE